jgi:hypothetical protein
MHHVTYSGNLGIVKILELHHISKIPSFFWGGFLAGKWFPLSQRSPVLNHNGKSGAEYRGVIQSENDKT